MRDFAATLVRARDAAAADALATPLSPEALQLLDDEVRRLTRGGDVFSTGYEIAPTGSINYGSAGAAAGLLRIACARGDASLLAAAAVWYSRALGHAGNPASFYNAALEIGPDVLGPVSPYHTESGIHAAGALIAHARGDETAFRSAVAAFVRASNVPCEELDVTLGRSGTLLAASLLLDVTAGSAGAEYPETAVLRALGDETMHDLWRQLDERPPLADSPANTFLGIAHGWAGYLYAALLWSHSSGTDLPRGAATRLEELAAQRVRRGNTSYWKRQVGSGARDVMAGWCNGSAGYVFLWTLAHRVTGDERWLKIAEEVAQHAWEEPMQTADLCCGSAGRAYAYLNLYKHTGATIWLSRARHAANHAASTASATAARPHALWKGELGVAVLIADLASPETAAMPFFESA
jgi:serine/threonine-protein kinase